MTSFGTFWTNFIFRRARLQVILIVLVSAFITLFWTVCIVISLLPSCVLWSARIWSTAETASTSLWGLVIRRVISTTPSIYIITCFGVVCPPNGFIFIVRLCSIPFSRRIAYSYASWRVRAWANSSSAIFFVVHVCCKHVSNPFIFYGSTISPWG